MRPRLAAPLLWPVLSPAASSGRVRTRTRSGPLGSKATPGHDVLPVQQTKSVGRTALLEYCVFDFADAPRCLRRVFVVACPTGSTIAVRCHIIDTRAGGVLTTFSGCQWVGWGAQGRTGRGHLRAGLCVRLSFVGSMRVHPGFLREHQPERVPGHPGLDSSTLRPSAGEARHQGTE